MTTIAMTRSCAGAVLCLFLIGTASGAADLRVLQKDKAFSQARVSIRAGDTIIFVNADTVAHNIYSMSRGLEFEIRTQLPGQTDSVQFARPGVAEVQCAIHPRMTLVVNVAP